MGRTHYKVYKNKAIKAAQDLFYGDGVIEQLEAASSVGEIEHIMNTARRRRFKESNDNSIFVGGNYSSVSKLFSNNKL